MSSVYIVAACRTPIGRFQGIFREYSAVELGVVAVSEALRRAGVEAGTVDEVIMGNVLQAGLGQNPARQAALGSGLPPTVSALTVNMVCGSGLKAVTLAGHGIHAGDVALAVAGGMESMTHAPYLLRKARSGYRLGHGELIDSLIHDGLWDAYENYHMGCTAEVVARQYGVIREAQDQYAAESHRRALQATRAGWFQDEIAPVQSRLKGGDEDWVRDDEGPRQDSSVESLARLKPAFEPAGTVTAGNASQLSDGAAALVIASEEAVRRHGLDPFARIVASASSGIEPRLVMMAPLKAVEKVLQRSGWQISEVDLYEINEAFAAQSVALCREIPLDPERLNLHGGAVALGHPIGASGARVLTTLLYALKRNGLKRGVASLCLGGGNAVAMAVEIV